PAPADSAMAFPARPRSHLFLGLFLSRLSDSRSDRPCRHSPGRKLPSADSSSAWSLAAILVCANFPLGFEWKRTASRAVLGRPGGFAIDSSEHLAASHAAGVLHMFPFVCQRGAGFLRLSV